MDQDKAFNEYWEQAKKRLMMACNCDASEEQLKALARESWYGALNAQKGEAAFALHDAARLSRAEEERDWFRAACAEVMGCDAPGGDAAHPLRDWLKSLKAYNEFGEASTEGMLLDLYRRGGAAGALGEAGLLFERKGRDYNTGFGRDDYFPMGLQSYAQMVWVKAMRLLSFARAPRAEVHEKIRDTLLDLINYAAFAADWLKRQPTDKEVVRGGAHRDR